MHSPIYIGICAASLAGVFLVGIPDESIMLLGTASAIAAVGVPHGGLDHWTGRRLLENRFKHFWWIVFFPAYLMVGLVCVLGWFLAPSFTVVLFFLVSAWHFGREDQQSNAHSVSSSRVQELLNHVAATATGGLIIWFPALVRPDELRSLLNLIVPAGSSEPVSQIIEASQIIGLFLVPLAMFDVVQRLVVAPRDFSCWVPFATGVIAIGLPILLSFSLFFCGWHSWQGLQRLRRYEALTAVEFVRCVAPLSVAAIAGVAAMGWWGKQWAADVFIDGQTPQTLRTMFIGLSSIAVPHLVLHELHALVARSQSKLQVFA